MPNGSGRIAMPDTSILTPHGQLEITEETLRLTTSGGVVSEWRSPLWGSENTLPLTNAVLSAIREDTDVIAHPVVLSWIKARQLELALNTEWAKGAPKDEREASKSRANTAKQALKNLAEAIIDSAEHPSRCTDVVRAERFDELMQGIKPFFDVWWPRRGESKTTQKPAPRLDRPGEVEVLREGKWVKVLNAYSTQEDWNYFFAQRTTERKRPEVALQQAVYVQLAEETEVEYSTLSSQVSRGRRRIRDETLKPFIQSLRKLL
jgi:hypothetical protein